MFCNKSKGLKMSYMPPDVKEEGRFWSVNVFSNTMHEQAEPNTVCTIFEFTIFYRLSNYKIDYVEIIELFKMCVSFF